jgi:tRNA uridine 5-carbamoylmethylation protein Kti12
MNLLITIKGQPGQGKTYYAKRFKRMIENETSFKCEINEPGVSRPSVFDVLIEIIEGEPS